jgi:predicted MPP superfamily phosphohydrolase
MTESPARSPTRPSPRDPFRSPSGSISRRVFLKTGFLATAGLALYSAEIERHWIDIRHVDVKLRNLPKSLRGFRIAQLADFHYGEFSEPTYIRAAVRATNDLKPDLVALTGDFISAGPMVQRISVQFAHHCADLLARLTCPLRYAVMGNHDVIVSRRAVTEALTSHGIPVLHNQAVPIERDGSRFWLAGVADVLMGGEVDLAAALPASRDRRTEPLVLMAHEPDYADSIIGSGVDLMLSGHTHGGQVRIPFVPPFDLPPLGRKYIEGLFSLGNLQLYVTRGIGTVGVPFRFRCRPEITVIRLIEMR